MYRRILGRRLNSTNLPWARSAPTKNPFVTYLVAGAAGGVAGSAILVTGFYAWYHFSGLKETVDTANHITAIVTKGAQKTETQRHVAVNFLRAITNFAAPNLSPLINTSFDIIEEVYANNDQLNGVLVKGLEDMKDAIGKAQLDPERKAVLVDALKKRSEELNKVGGDFVGSIREKTPEVVTQLGTYWTGLQKGENGVQEWRALLKTFFDPVLGGQEKGVENASPEISQSLVQDTEADIEGMYEEEKVLGDAKEDPAAEQDKE